MKARQYEMFELTFQGKAPEGSAVDVNLQAVFSNKQETVTVKGFYAGKDTYKVRILPQKIGIYTYEITGIIQDKGTFEVTPEAPGSHGPIHPEGTHLQYADGTNFFSFGTTVYALAHQSKELTEETFATLEKAPFNKIRMCVFPKHYHYNHNEPLYYPFEVLPGCTFEPKDALSSPAGVHTKPVWDVKKPNYEFWDAFEEKIQRFQKMGIQVDLILFHPYDRWGFAYFSQEDNLIYLDYLLRRLAALPNVWWSMANEYDLCASKTLEDWHEIEKFIANNDPYHHMLSNHNCFKYYDFGREAVTHCSLQAHNMNLVTEFQNKYHKPVCYDECTYEGNLKETWGSISGKEMTRRFWEVTVTGGYCTHGEVILDQADENLKEAVLWWAKGGKLKGTSPEHITYLRALMEEIGQPLDPLVTGLGRLYHMTEEERLKEQEECTDEGFKAFLGAIGKMNAIELIRHIDTESDYAGHAGEDVYLYYYGINCCARVDIELPIDHSYTIEVIDTWNMTRETVMQRASGVTEVRLPSREYMAVLAKREK